MDLRLNDVEKLRCDWTEVGSQWPIMFEHLGHKLGDLCHSFHLPIRIGIYNKFTRAYKTCNLLHPTNPPLLSLSKPHLT
jgi:hypothetical protein